MENVNSLHYADFLVSTYFSLNADEPERAPGESSLESYTLGHTGGSAALGLDAQCIPEHWPIPFIISGCRLCNHLACHIYSFT